MLPFEHAGRQAVFDLVFSGIGDQIRTGDTIGVWTFGEELRSGIFPMQVWAPDQNLQLASSIGLFLKNQRYDSQGRLDHVTPKLGSLMKAVKDVNILMISGDEHTWKGTGFDGEINLAFQKKVLESRNSKRPLITSLVVRDGAVVDWSITLPGEPIALPKPIAPDKIVKAGKGTNSHNVAANAGAAGSHQVVTMHPLDNTETRSPNPGSIKSIVITSRGTVTNAETSEDAQTTGRGQETFTAITRPLPEVAPSDARVEIKMPKEANATSIVAVGAPLVKNNTPPGVEASSAAKPLNTPLAALTPEPLPIAAREQPGAPELAAPAPATPAMAMAGPPEPFFTPRRSFLIGTAFMVVALGILALAMRLFRRAPQPSFISRSIDRRP